VLVGFCFCDFGSMYLVILKFLVMISMLDEGVETHEFSCALPYNCLLFSFY
jgi:hypothetical protein